MGRNKDYLIKGYVLFMSPCARYEDKEAIKGARMDEYKL